MAIATYSTDLTDMDLAASATGWAEATATGWTSVFAVTGGETDDYIQNTTCNSTTVKTGVGALLYNNGSGITLNQDDAVLVWCKWDVYPSLDTEANGGIRTVMGSALNAFYRFDHLGSDSYIYDGWINLATGDPADADITPTATVGSPTTTKQYHGWAFNALSVPSKGNPYKVDAIRYGRCEIICIDGQAAAYGNFADMAEENDYNDGTNGYQRWGLFRKVTTDNYLWKGLMTLGNATATDFRDTNSTIAIDNTKHVTPAFNAIEINNASSRVDWTGVTISALGTVARGTFTVVDDCDVNFTSCTFNDMSTFNFLATSSVIGCNFNRCGLITAGNADFDGCIFTEPTVVADEGAVFDDRTTTASETITDYDNTTFSKGTNSHHALRFGTGVAHDITLSNIDFTGFGSVADATDAVFRFDATSGSINLNLIGCTTDGTFSVDDAAGITVTVVIDPVTTLVHIDDNDGVDLQNCNVLLEAADGLGDFPFEDTVTITHVTTTASVSHTLHGLSDNDKIVIRDANETEYNGVFTITNTTTNAYDYTMDSDPGANATGTILASGAIIAGLTDIGGDISASRTFVSNTLVKGVARKSTASPRFKSFPLSGEINNSTGLTVNARLIIDE